VIARQAQRYRSRNIRNTFILGCVIIGAVAGIIIGEETSNNFTCDPSAHRVEYGDTLWGIAEAKCEGDIQRVTDNLVDVYGTNIQLAQYIYLPVSENCLITLSEDGQVYDSCDE
jgi:hypothetical protein